MSMPRQFTREEITTFLEHPQKLADVAFTLTDDELAPLFEALALAIPALSFTQAESVFATLVEVHHLLGMVCMFQRTAAVILDSLMQKIPAQKLYDICKRTDPLDESNFSRLVENCESGINRNILINILERFSDQQISELLPITNRHFNRTFLHSGMLQKLNPQQSDRIIAIFNKPLVKAVIKKIALQQDVFGDNLFNWLSGAKPTLYEFMLGCLEDKTLYEMLQLRNQNGGSFIEYAIRNYPLDTIRKIHVRAMAAQTICGGDYYYKAIIDLANSFTTNYDTIAIPNPEKLQYLFDILNEILDAENFPAEYLYKDSGRALPRSLEILLAFVYLSNLRFESRHIIDLCREPLKKIFAKIPTQVFINDIVKFKNQQLSHKFKRHEINLFIRKLLYKTTILPYEKTEPAKILKLFLDGTVTYQYAAIFLTDPKNGFLFWPEKFCDFFQPIVDYQLGLGTKLNRDYIVILNKALATKDRTDSYLIYYRRLTHMALLLQAAAGEKVDRNILLTLSISPELTALQLEQTSDLLNLTLNATDQNQTETSLLALKMLQFKYAATLKYHAQPRVSQTVEKQNTADEKFASLDDTAIVASSVEPDQAPSNAIGLLNTRIHAITGTDEIPSFTTIAHEEYEQANAQLLDSMQESLYSQWHGHLQQLNAYIDLRQNENSCLFYHRHKDLVLRQHYYDLIVKIDDSLDSILQKIDVIDNAMKNPNITGGWRTNRFLTHLQRLRTDYEAWMLLIKSCPEDKENLLGKMNGIFVEESAFFARP